MKKFAFIFFISPLFAGAQETMALFPSLDVIVGTHAYNSSFDNFSTLNNFNFNNPPNIIGLGAGGAMQANRMPLSYWYKYWTCSIMLPREIVFQDGLKAKIMGSRFELSAAGMLFFHESRRINVGLSPGIAIGQLRLFGNDSARQKNAFLSPMISIHPRIRFSYALVFSARLSYEWDISQPQWCDRRKADNNQLHLDNFNQSGFSLFFTLGYDLRFITWPWD